MAKGRRSNILPTFVPLPMADIEILVVYQNSVYGGMVPMGFRQRLLLHSLLLSFCASYPLYDSIIQMPLLFCFFILLTFFC